MSSKLSIEDIEEQLTNRNSEWAAERMEEGHTVQYGDPSKLRPLSTWRIRNNRVQVTTPRGWVNTSAKPKEWARINLEAPHKFKVVDD